MSDMLVRIYPVSKRHGHCARSYNLAGSGYPPFRVERGWYTVDGETAEKLRSKLNNPADKRSAPIFQVVTPAEARALDSAETMQVAKATGPVPIPAKVKAGHPAKQMTGGDRASKERNLRTGKVLETGSENDGPEPGYDAPPKPVRLLKPSAEDAAEATADTVERLHKALADATAALKAATAEKIAEATGPEAAAEELTDLPEDPSADEPEGDDLGDALDDALPDDADLSEPMSSDGEEAPSRPASNPTVADARTADPTNVPAESEGRGDLTSAAVRENSTPTAQADKLTPTPTVAPTITPKAAAPKPAATAPKATPKPKAKK